MKRQPIRALPAEKFRGALALVLLAFFVLGAGCVGIDDLSRESYRKGVLFTSNLSNERIAILPMTAKGENRHYLQQAESIFYKALTEMREEGNLLSPQALDDFFRVFEKETSFKKVAEERDMSKFRKILGTRFLLQTELQQVEVLEGATQVRIQGRLWDIEMGDVIWEGTGESRGYLILFFPRVPATFEKAIEVASRGLIRKLP
jgi:TolB-like protein